MSNLVLSLFDSARKQKLQILLPHPKNDNHNETTSFIVNMAHIHVYMLSEIGILLHL